MVNSPAPPLPILPTWDRVTRTTTFALGSLLHYQSRFWRKFMPFPQPSQCVKLFKRTTLIGPVPGLWKFVLLSLVTNWPHKAWKHIDVILRQWWINSRKLILLFLRKILLHILLWVFLGNMEPSPPRLPTAVTQSPLMSRGQSSSIKSIKSIASNNFTLTIPPTSPQLSRHNLLVEECKVLKDIAAGVVFVSHKPRDALVDGAVHWAHQVLFKDDVAPKRHIIVAV